MLLHQVPCLCRNFWAEFRLSCMWPRLTTERLSYRPTIQNSDCSSYSLLTAIQKEGQGSVLHLEMIFGSCFWQVLLLGKMDLRALLQRSSHMTTMKYNCIASHRISRAQVCQILILFGGTEYLGSRPSSIINSFTIHAAGLGKIG